MQTKKVLFVCTGNIFRSMSAEYCFRHFLSHNNITGVESASAGTVARIQQARKSLVDTLMSLGINPMKHKQRRLTVEMFDIYDVVVAMSKTHQDFIYDTFGIVVPLFNSIAYDKNTSVDDLEEAIVNYRTAKKTAERYIIDTALYIHDSMPFFWDWLSKKYFS